MTRVRRHADSGATALTALLVWAVVTMVGLLVITTAADLSLTALRAQAGADAAALAAAGATVLGPAPAAPGRAAEIAASLHDVLLLRCCGDTEAIPPRVEVWVSAPPRSPLGRLLRDRLVRGATASLRPAKTAVAASGLAENLPNSAGNGVARRPRR